MGSSDKTASAAPSPEFLAAFQARAGQGGALSFADFMALALYDPVVGYYRQARPRVGYGGGTDFFTASTSGPIFGELLVAACAKLVRDAGADPRDYTWVEIGSETEGGVLTGVEHPFAGVRTLQLGAPLALEGRCVVFSNELFDAQPFRRFVFCGGVWRELGVALRESHLWEVELSVVDTASPSILAPLVLPTRAPEGYVVDAPLAAVALADALAAQPWTGLFVACDYGKTWTELAEATPAGTARAYFRHTQSNDLLARPGEQDITCHVCWDWLEGALANRGFTVGRVESQEAFFVKHAGDFMAATSAAEAARFTKRKLALMQLLHPAHLGQKFQVLRAWRS